MDFGVESGAALEFVQPHYLDLELAFGSAMNSRYFHVLCILLFMLTLSNEDAYAPLVAFHTLTSHTPLLTHSRTTMLQLLLFPLPRLQLLVSRRPRVQFWIHSLGLWMGADLR